MKRKIIFLTGFVFFMVLGLHSGSMAAANSFKLAVVDIQKFQEKKFDSLQQKLDAEKTELVKLEDELKKQSMMLSLDAKENREWELETKKRQIKFLFDESTFEMKRAEAEATRRVGVEIEKLVQAIGQKEGYDIIFEKRTLGLLFYKNALDITDEVIAAYDKQMLGK